MVRVVSRFAPAWMPALFFSSVLLLQGCSLLPGRSAPADAAEGSPVASGSTRASTRDAFTLQVIGPDAERDYLSKHLEIQRYRQVDDLGASELSRLMVAAEGNARELLGTLGYFAPTLTLELKETPDSSKAPREVVVTVVPGAQTRVSTVQIAFTGPIEADAAAEAQRDGIRTAWSLRAGQPFTQQAWDNAKTVALRNLTAKRFPTGSIAISRAEVDADRSEARLGVTYQSGPAYRFGLLKVNGSERYDPDAARRIARLPTGSDYDQQKLLDAQQRLASSGYYDSVFLTLDTDGTDPLAAPVTAQLREAPLQKIVLGAGFTTDSGPRLSIDHI
ncbi:MAG: outer membrane protein assembly factor, partial [Comamonadaceae bacterium]